jgi:glycosyltransferase involved in cell wall biosynthesis
MRIHWAVNTNYIGIGFGYSTHQKRLREGLERQGVEITEKSDIAVHLTTPDAFRPIPGKFNILYTMYECTTLPKRWVDPINKAHALVVPCRQNVALFRNYTKLPLALCWEGVEVDKYTYIEREFPEDRPFTYLWLGASNPRKGTEHIIYAWERFNIELQMRGMDRTKFLLILKTTQERDREVGVNFKFKNKQGKLLWEETKSEKMPAERLLQVAGNAIFDSRRLPVLPVKCEYNLNEPNSLQEIYHAAHCFVLPTRGEGFGLTLAEAAATGCPCIYTPWGGPKDFMSRDTGYPLKFKFSPVRAIGYRKNKESGKMEKYISHESQGADADIDHIVRRMFQVYFDYKTALEKGKKAAENIRAGFTWDISAQSFIKIVENWMPVIQEKLKEIKAA